MMKTIRIVLGALLIVFCVSFSASGQKKEIDAPPAGEYSCLVSSLQMFMGRLQIQYLPSAIGRLRMDGKNIYQTMASGRSGRYSFNPSSGVIDFTTGPLEGWPTLYWADSAGNKMIRLARSKDATVNPMKGPATGEHRCRLRPSGK
jgi:hypothetical protein